MWLDSFVLLCLGHMLMGIFLGGLGFLRFEAIDRSPGDLRDQAISLAMFGGVLAGLIGPSLVLGAAGLAGPLPADSVTLGLLMPVLVVASLVLICTSLLKQPLGVRSGLVFVGFYLAFLGLQLGTHNA